MTNIVTTVEVGGATVHVLDKVWYGRGTLATNGYRTRVIHNGVIDTSIVSYETVGEALAAAGASQAIIAEALSRAA